MNLIQAQLHEDVNMIISLLAAHCISMLIHYYQQSYNLTKMNVSAHTHHLKDSEMLHPISYFAYQSYYFHANGRTMEKYDNK